MITFRFSRLRKAERYTRQLAVSWEGDAIQEVKEGWCVYVRERERERERDRMSRGMCSSTRMEERPDGKGSWKRELRKRGKRQCSITTQPNGSTITAPILPAQLNYCVERPREISGIDIESVAVAARAAHRNGERGWWGWGQVRQRGRERVNRWERKPGMGAGDGGRIFTRTNLPGTKARFHGITFNKFKRSAAIEN